MLYSLLEKSTKNRPDAIALWSYSYTCTYFELNEKVTISSDGLSKKGLKKGDRIASYLHNCPEAIELYFACFKIGVSVVIIHPCYREFQIRFLIETAEPKLCYTLRIV
jgi:long-chain acyl-CoA synthetase